MAEVEKSAEIDTTIKIDTTNKFMVAAQGGSVRILRMPVAPLTRDEALMLAAWLVAMSMKSLADFELAYEAVCNT